MRKRTALCLVIFSAFSAGCERKQQSIDIDPNASASNANGSSTNSGDDFGSGAGSASYSSADLYSAGVSDSGLGLPSDTSLSTSSSVYGTAGASSSSSALGPNDPRPPSQGAAMALQVLPQLLSCLEQQCNPTGMIQNLIGPMLAQLGAAGGQSGGLAAAGLGQLSGLLNQGIAGLQQAAGAQYGLNEPGGEEVLDEE